jgi:hypothetical protein
MRATAMQPMIAEQRPTDGRQVVRSYDTYAPAQEAVDRLADASFPVGSVEIVGHDLSIVEMVTGRLTTARAAAAGAGSGAWFGLFIGLLVGLFTTGPEWVGLVVGGLVIGAVWGAVFGFIAHSATQGRRDFASTRALVAARYDVLVADTDADKARRMLGASA